MKCGQQWTCFSLLISEDRQQDRYKSKIILSRFFFVNILPWMEKKECCLCFISGPKKVKSRRKIKERLNKNPNPTAI